MRTSRYAQGTRVEVRRGRFPMDSRLVGRRGLVLELSDYAPGRYGVQLEGESVVREFTEDELRALTPEPMPEEKAGGMGPGIR